MIKPSMTFIVIIMVFEAEICMFHTAITFIPFGFSRLFTVY
jgi:hypothetical protein